jgi:succinoglycan biosynthesis transport protein ExoP
MPEAHHKHTGPLHGVSSPGGPNSLHLFDRFAVVVKYYKAVAIVALLVIAGMMYHTYTVVPMFRAQSRLHIEEEHTAQSDFKEPYLAYQDPEPYYQTQYRILQGRDLARRAARRLKLESVPEFNGTGATPTRLTQALDLIKRKALAPFTPASDPATAVRIDENALISAFQSRIEVAPVRSTRLVDISFRAADAEFAARAINAIAEEYVQQNLEGRLQNTDKMLSWLTQEVARQQAIVQERERLLAEYRENQNAMSLDDDNNIVVAQLNAANEAVQRARTQRMQREALHNQVVSAENRGTLTAVVQNPLVQSLRARLNELERDRTRLNDRYGEKHPEVLKVGSLIAETQRQVDLEVDKTVQGIRNDYQTAVSEERALANDLEAKKRAVADLSRKSVDYSVLQREAESDRQVYESLLNREKELRVVSNSRANNVRLLDRAEVPALPFTPDVKRAWTLALLLGLSLGVAAAFVIDYLDDTVKTPEDVRWRLKLPFLGLVPKVDGNERPLLSDAVPPQFGEAFRALRTALVNASGDQDTKIIATTSAQPLEGKTTTAVNLALALAIGGAKVLLIDADMRRPSLHKALRLKNEKGLAQLLAEKARMREVVQATVHPNLLAVTAGLTPSNPSELLASERMKAFIQTLSESPFDWVIIDTPPVLAVTDAVILAPLVSGITFVVGAEMTRYRMAERAIETLQQGKAKSITAVLNRVDFERNRYYYWRYYGNQYGNYYGEAAAS